VTTQLIYSEMGASTFLSVKHRFQGYFKRTFFIHDPPNYGDCN